MTDKTSTPAAIVSPAEMLQSALANGSDNIEVLSRLMDLEERYQAKHSRALFVAALAAFQSSAPPLAKDATVSYGGGKTAYQFAPLHRIAARIREPLYHAGLSYRYEIEQADGWIRVHCIVMHDGGHTERTSMSGPLDTSGSKNPVQAIGSTVTYLKRYTLLAALGLETGEDDDGQSAGRPVETCSQQDAEEIERLATDAGVLDKVLAYAGVADPSEIPAGKVSAILRNLRNRGES